MPSWSEDSFSKWWASNKSTYVTGIVSGAITGLATVGMGAAMLSGNAPASAAATAALERLGSTTMTHGFVSLANTAIKAYGSYQDKKSTPDQMKGQFGNNTIRIKQNRLGYTFYNTTITYDNAKKIDNFFTMFGYAIKQVKVPNIQLKKTTSSVALRPYWNYIKNINTIILSTGTSPNRYVNEEVESKLKEIYNNGITYWMIKKLQQDNKGVGDYSLDNSPQ